ncbi:alpha/beta fold hydrolase [Candidatus Woesearchaeota archaeon]|nr:MAG: alpha/beta fold hydrolase [Candidatus Woesearchaeota archaeon]
MPLERFEIQNEKEFLLRGIIETKHPRKRQPVIIFVNGFLDTMGGRGKATLAKKFQEDGYVTARFDYTYGFGSGSGDPARFTLSHAIADLERVIEYVMRRGYVDPERIVLFGFCFGAMAAIMLAAFDERVKAVVSLSCPYEFTDTSITRKTEHEMARIRLKRYYHISTPFSEQEQRIDYSFFEDGERRDMPRAVRNLRQPLLVVHGEKDEKVPLANAEEISRRSPGETELEVLQGYQHELSGRQLGVVHKRVRDFLQKHLKRTKRKG